MKTKIEVTLSCFVRTFMMEIIVPINVDAEEYIDEFLESILSEEFRYNVEWNFV